MIVLHNQDIKGNDGQGKKVLKHFGLWPVESLSLDLEALDRKVERDIKARLLTKSRYDIV